MKKVLVIGASGLVGSRFCELTKNKFNVIAVDENILDITDESSTIKYFDQNKFDTVVNFAAYTDVAKAEDEWNDETGICYKLNVLAPRYLAEACKKSSIFFVQISTDFCFEGLSDSKGPFDEDQELPKASENLCWYGWTKNLAEKEIKKVGLKHAIVRIANPFRSNFPLKLDFARKILDLYDKDSLFPLFTDQVITPIFIDELVSPLVKIIEESLEGVYHIVSSDTGTYYEVGSYILEKARGVKNVTKEASLVEFMKTPDRNKRPIFGGLSSAKTQEKLGMKFKTWREMVDEFVEQLN